MRSLATVLSLFALTGVARAHFVFVYVEGGAEARVVFGHAAATDPSNFPTRAERTTLTARDAAGKERKLAVERGDGNFYRAKLPKETAVVYGTTEAGVTQRADNPPMLTWYHPKTIVGDPFAKGATVGGAVPLEIVPERSGDGVRFRVLSAGKPVGDVEVTVGLPGGGEEKSQAVKTDKDGVTTAFAETGRYCVAARTSDSAPGELAGKKYAATRRIATVVFDFPKPGK